MLLFFISPLSVYHLGLPMNSFTSSTILSAKPFSSTTEDRGRRRLGNPNGLHSAPRAVYITVRPSSCFKASSRAARTQNQSLRLQHNSKEFSRQSHTFLKYVEEYLPVSAQSSESDRLPGCSSVQVHHLLFPGPLHSDPLPAIPEKTHSLD